MKETGFSLRAFDVEDNLKGYSITGKASRDLNRITLLYELSGPLDLLKIPLLSDKPCRKTRLWEETCIELFIGTKESETYWEFNLSPSLDWNVYRFNTYREGMQEEPGFDSLPFQVQITGDALRLSLGFDTSLMIGSYKPAALGISTVLKSITNRVCYWALVHNGPVPDFHRKDSLIIELNP